VVLVDDGEICSGETGRTTAHLVSAVDDRYFKLEQDFGKSGAKTMAEAHKTAINTIERIVTQEKIDCDFQRLDGYLFLSPEHKIDFLKKELKASFEAGLKVELVEGVPGDTFSSGPALRFPKQGQFDPLKVIGFI
jgi:glycine/D-amino acid oxidase-like deaminating enzyme